MQSTFAITGPVFIIIAIGFITGRLGFFLKTDVRTLSTFVINFAFPALIFKALSQGSLSEIINVYYLLAYTLGSVAVMLGGIAIAYFGKKKPLTASTLYGMGMSASKAASSATL